MPCIPQVDGEYVTRMEDVLDYAEAPDSERPVCFDEGPAQLIGETRQPIPADDSNVTITSIVAMARSISSFSSPCIVPGARSKSPSGARQKDHAQCMREFVDIQYPGAETIRVVQGRPGQSIDPFRRRPLSGVRACRSQTDLAADRVPLHPKHASWLEIGVLRGQCLDRRIRDAKRLRREITAWEQQRNTPRSRFKWMFITENARAKIGRAYPDTSKET